MNYLELERQRMRFGLMFCLFIVIPFLVMVYLFHSPRQCLTSETTTTIETYYDFSESGMGVWQAPSTKTTCTAWKEFPNRWESLTK